MKIKVQYTTGKRKRWDRITGTLTAVAVNTLILIATREVPFLAADSSSLTANLDLLPWIINGLFLLVFGLILPQFSLGYLTALLIFIAVSIMAGPMSMVGCLWLISFFAFAETILAEVNKTLGEIRTILSIVGPFVLIAGITLIWMIAVYYSDKENN